MSALPVAASAQVNVSVGVDLDANAYDTTAPGDPVESVDVFYDQLQPYGVWVDEPDIGRVFIPNDDGFVPYTVGHWEYTRLGFVWVSNQPFAWATTHYGRWAYSNPYGRWVWLPDTEWGPAWVQWRQTDNDFGWAPLPPTRISYEPPAESWHYCGAAHVLDVNVTRYYEPRDRVVVIHREARPIEHYQTVNNVKVVVGPPPSVLHEHRVEVKPARVDARVVGRWTPTEAHAQVTRAQEHKATFEVENQRRLDSNTHIHAAQQKVIETHPQIKVQADARIQAAKTGHAEPTRMEPNRNEPRNDQHAPTPTPTRVEPNRNENRNDQHAPTPMPTRVEPNRNETRKDQHAPTPMPTRVEPNRNENRNDQHAPTPMPTRVEPNRNEQHAPTPTRVEPNRNEQHAPTPPPTRVEPQPQPREQRPAPTPAPVHAEPARPAPQPHEQRPAPAPAPAPAPHGVPAHPAPHAEPATPAESGHGDKREEKK